MGRYLNKAKHRDIMYACACIYIKFDMGKGVLEAIELQVDVWIHL
jgi:hypothetical protein